MENRNAALRMVVVLQVARSGSRAPETKWGQIEQTVLKKGVTYLYTSSADPGVAPAKSPRCQTIPTSKMGRHFPTVSETTFRFEGRW